MEAAWKWKLIESHSDIVLTFKKYLMFWWFRDRMADTVCYILKKRDASSVLYPRNIVL